MFCNILGALCYRLTYLSSDNQNDVLIFFVKSEVYIINYISHETTYKLYDVSYFHDLTHLGTEIAVTPDYDFSKQDWTWCVISTTACILHWIFLIARYVSSSYVNWSSIDVRFPHIRFREVSKVWALYLNFRYRSDIWHTFKTFIKFENDPIIDHFIIQFCGFEVYLMIRRLMG